MRGILRWQLRTGSIRYIDNIEILNNNCEHILRNWDILWTNVKKKTETIFENNFRIVEIILTQNIKYWNNIENKLQQLRTDTLKKKQQYWHDWEQYKKQQIEQLKTENITIALSNVKSFLLHVMQ